jgi:hypothetical protein
MNVGSLIQSLKEMNWWLIEKIFLFHFQFKSSTNPHIFVINFAFFGNQFYILKIKKRNRKKDFLVILQYLLRKHFGIKKKSLKFIYSLLWSFWSDNFWGNLIYSRVGSRTFFYQVSFCENYRRTRKNIVQFIFH